MAEVFPIRLFVKPKSLATLGVTVDDTLDDGTYYFAGASTNGLTAYSGILIVLQTVKILISKDKFCFKRGTDNWKELQYS